jgi:hypothetical protein
MLLIKLFQSLQFSQKEQKDLLAVIANNLEDDVHKTFFNSLLSSSNTKESLITYLIAQDEDIRDYCEEYIIKKFSIEAQKYLCAIFEYLSQISINKKSRTKIKQKIDMLDFHMDIKSDIGTYINKLIKGKLSQKELLEFEKIISNKSSIKISEKNIFDNIKDSCLDFLSFSNSNGEYGILELKKSIENPKTIHIFINGFTNDNKYDKGFNKWIEHNIFSKRYDSLYGFHWPSGQDIKGHVENINILDKQSKLVNEVKKFATFLKPSPLVIPGIAIQSVAEWKNAKNNSEKYSLELIDFIKNEKNNNSNIKINLYGHSLGVNLIHHTLNRLTCDKFNVNDIYLFGGASKNCKDSWNTSLYACDNIYNFYSKNDDVLSYLFKFIEIGDEPIGLTPIIKKNINENNGNLYNYDVSTEVKNHSSYTENLPYFFSLAIKEKDKN